MRPANDNLSAIFLRKEWKRRASELYRSHEAMHDALRARSKAINESFEADKRRSFADRQKKLDDYPALVKAAFRLNWRNWFQAERNQRWRFTRRERSALGKMWNMAATAHELRSGTARQRVGTREQAQGNAFGVLLAVLSKTERFAALERRLQRERKKVAGRQWEAINDGLRAIRAEARAHDDARRKTYLEEIKALRADETQAEAAMRRSADPDAEGRRKLPWFIDPIEGRLKIEKTRC